MAGYIGNRAVGLNVTTGNILGDVAAGGDVSVGDDLTVTDDAAIGGNLAVTGVVTANAGVVVDNFTLDGTTLALSSGDFTLDVAGDIILDAAGNDFILKSGATGTLLVAGDTTGGDFYMRVEPADKNFKINGTDGSTAITALDLDMALAGTATFNSKIIASNGLGATNGVTFFEGYYTAGNSLNTFGSMRSSGATVIGHAVEPSGSTGDGFVSSAAINNTRSAIVLGGNTITFSGAAASNVARGNAVTMTDRMTIETNGDVTIEDGNLVVGTAGHGINFHNFGAGAPDNNLLNDYEEGTWTIGWGGADLSGNTTAFYTKIGNFVYFHFYSSALNITNSTGNLHFTGLPFAARNIASGYSIFSTQHQTLFNDVDVDGGYIAINGTAGYFVKRNTSTGIQPPNGNGKYVMLSGMYTTDS